MQTRPDAAARPTLVLLAHGSRQPGWARPFDAVLDLVRAARPDREVVLAFLETMSPDLDTVLDAAADRGCVEARVIPLFLGAGGHLQRDVPERVAAVMRRRPELRVTVAPAAGESAELIAALAAYAAAG